MNSTELRRPRLKAPAGTTDTHIHIYDHRYPTAKTASFTPPDALLAEYREVCALVGIERTIVVQPTTYGSDHRCTLEAIAALGMDRARGVAMLAPDVTDQELERLTKAGMRGIRFQMFPGGINTWDQLEGLAARVKPFGWHAILQHDGRNFPEREDLIKRIGSIVTVVLDHTGKFIEPVPVDHPSFQSMLRLVDSGKFYVKIAGPYETSKVGAPLYEDVGALAKVLIRHAPERTMWASNFPQVNPPGGIRPDNAELLDVLLEWAPDDATRKMILVDNPAGLYGF